MTINPVERAAAALCRLRGQEPEGENFQTAVLEVKTAHGLLPHTSAPATWNPWVSDEETFDSPGAGPDDDF